jgi:hypothetical protein
MQRTHHIPEAIAATRKEREELRELDRGKAKGRGGQIITRVIPARK